MPEAQPQEPNIDEMIDAAMDDAPGGLLPMAAADFPMARIDELLRAIQGPALRAVLDARINQIVKQGHTAERDALLSIINLPDKAIELARIARSRIGVTGADRNLPAARKGLARAAALCMAAIDRLDMIKEGSDGDVA